MTISVKHKFTNPKPDSTDPTIVRPSNWNDEHNITMAASRLFGRYDTTAGAAQEVRLGDGLKWDTDTIAIDANNVSEVAYFAASTPPTGWLKANGAAVSRTTYDKLFASIGTFYGAGDGTTTFNLPDLRGEFVRALDDGRGLDTSRTLGSVQAGQNLSHVHGISDPGHAHSISDPSHAHGIGDPGHAHTYYDTRFSGNIASNGSGAGGAAKPQTSDPARATAAAGTGIWTGGSGTGIGIYGAGTGISVSANGGTEARPRNFALLACIKY